MPGASGRPETLEDAKAALLAAAIAQSHGTRRDRVPRATETALQRAQDQAVDWYEAMR